MKRVKAVIPLCLFLAALAFRASAQEPPAIGAGDVMKRLTVESLAATRAAIEKVRASARPVALQDGYSHVRAVLHCHSRLSHDSRGTPEEIAAAARATNTRIVFMTEHLNPAIDWFKAGISGALSDVLFVPGAETRGLLAYPDHSLQGLALDDMQAFVNDVVRGPGLAFFSHTEADRPWDLKGVTGMEIYNTHTAFILHPEMGRALTSGLPSLWRMIGLFRQYPQEALGSLDDYPAGQLARWDSICAKRPFVGIAANDSHSNTGIVVKVGPQKTLIVEDPLGERLGALDPAKAEGLTPDSRAVLTGLAAGPEGSEAFRFLLDPYERSFRHVGTYLLVKGALTEAGAREALRQGRTYIAFDWIADGAGFAFACLRGDKVVAVMGDAVSLDGGCELAAEAPVPGLIRLLRDGKVVKTQQGASMREKVTQPGVYRVESFLEVAGELRPWIISNPIYVTP